MKDRCSLIRPNLKTTDDIFDIQSSINFILVYSEDIEFNNNLLSATSDEDTLYKHLTKKSHKRNMKIRGTRKL
jgi:hypothetical protein